MRVNIEDLCKWTLILDRFYGIRDCIHLGLAQSGLAIAIAGVDNYRDNI